MQKGNGVKGKYMENMDYIIKNIDKLEDLTNYEWEYKNAEFILEFGGSEYLFLKQKNGICSNGKIESLRMRAISLLNLSELKFYGLKVILNEKPKITRKERNLLECFPLPKYFTRDKNGWLCMYVNEPILHQYPDAWGGDNELNIVLSNELFKFITWESQKAWTKEELMGLEVME